MAEIEKGQTEEERAFTRYEREKLPGYFTSTDNTSISQAIPTAPERTIEQARILLNLNMQPPTRTSSLGIFAPKTAIKTDTDVPTPKKTV